VNDEQGIDEVAGGEAGLPHQAAQVIEPPQAAGAVDKASRCLFDLSRLPALP
jgi:hypothetical protein